MSKSNNLRGDSSHLVECVLKSTGDTVWLRASEAVAYRDSGKVRIVKKTGRPAYIPRTLTRNN